MTDSQRSSPSLGDVIRLIRVNHWPKNLLLLVPLVTSQNLFETSELRRALTGFLAFSLAASGTYVINDILDVHSDRLHPVKRLRPVASGRVSTVSAVIIAVVLLGLGVALSTLLPPGFLPILVLYSVLSLLYSLVLKRLLLIDVVTLAALFILRVIAGAEAIEVSVSFWLFAFSLFFFASLALTKRCSELHNLLMAGEPGDHGRAYQVEDLATLRAIGVTSGTISVLVIALYIEDPVSSDLYSRPDVLWLFGPLLLYWVGRSWVRTGRGEMSEDPLMDSVRDPASWLVAVLGLIIVAVAA